MDRRARGKDAWRAGGGAANAGSGHAGRLTGLARGALAAMAMASLAGAGCGGAKRQPSRAQFSARAEAICAAEGRKLGYIRARARARGLAPRAPALLRKQAA